MKKMARFLFFLIVCSSFAQSQTWITQRISNNSGQSGEPSIAIDGNNVYIVWEDSTSGNSEIYFRSSKNGGTTWGLQKNLSNNSKYSGMPDIAVGGGSVFVVWSDNTLGNVEIFFRRSNNGGVTWSNTKRITNLRYSSFYPSIAAIDEQVFIAWADYSPGNWEIYFIKSNNRGVSWTPVKRLTNTPSDSWRANIAVNGGVVFVAWVENEDAPSENSHIFFKRSTNGGNSWKPIKKLNIGSISGFWPRLAVVDPVVYVVWTDYIDDEPVSNNFRKSINKGVSWTPTSSFEGNAGAAIDIAAIESNIYAVWDDHGLVYSESTDQGESWTNQKRLSNGSTFGIEIKIDELLKVYIVYADWINGNWDIFLKYTKD